MGLCLNAFTWMMSRCTSYNVAITADLLGEALTETGGQLHPYALVTNHVHLLVTPHSRLGRLLAVCHTYRPGAIQIINAPRVTRGERKLYEEG